VKVTQKGQYRLLEDIKTRNLCAVGMLLKGTIISITAIDDIYHKVIGPEFFDWIYLELPVEKVSEEVRQDD